MALRNNKNVCLKSLVNNKYLRFQNGQVQAYSLLQFSVDDAFDPYVQLEVVKTEGDTDLVHLKSRFNNKYLVRWAPDSNWISASADYPEDDPTNWACTLFKPILISDVGGTKKIRLQHIQLGGYASYGVAPFESYLWIGSGNVPDPAMKQDVFEVIDWESTLSFIRPKKVVFKGTDSGKYLGSTVFKDKNRVRFIFDDINDPKVEHEIIPSKDGFVCIRSSYLGKFWRRDEDDYDKIVVDLRDDPRLTNNDHGMFRVSVLGFNRIALLNASKPMYCKMHHSAETGSDFLLVVVGPRVDQWTPLQVIEKST
ncbi:uncharacterized protein LOC141637824 [Silene latifolia]|uniref:uncharacterized protein LOC141637824 n=1 Tax=Silene latifolia TaxID=37657 RepID=UPI003D78AC4F